MREYKVFKTQSQNLSHEVNYIIQMLIINIKKS